MQRWFPRPEGGRGSGAVSENGQNLYDWFDKRSGHAVKTIRKIGSRAAGAESVHHSCLSRRRQNARWRCCQKAHMCYTAAQSHGERPSFSLSPAPSSSSDRFGSRITDLATRIADLPSHSGISSSHIANSTSRIDFSFSRILASTLYKQVFNPHNEDSLPHIAHSPLHNDLSPSRNANLSPRIALSREHIDS